MAINRSLPVQNVTRVSQEPQLVHNISLSKDRTTLFLKGAAVLSLVASISSVAAAAFLLHNGFSAFAIGAYSIGIKSLFVLGGITAIVGAISGCLFYKKRNSPLPTLTQPLAPAQIVNNRKNVLQSQHLTLQSRTMLTIFFAAGFFAEAMAASVNDRLPELSTPETIRDVYYQFNQVNRYAKWSETWKNGESLKVTDAIKLFNKDNYPFIIRCLNTHFLKKKSDWTQFFGNIPLGKGAVITIGNDSVAIRHVSDHCWEFFAPQSLNPRQCWSLKEAEDFMHELVSRANFDHRETMEAFVLEVY